MRDSCQTNQNRSNAQIEPSRASQAADHLGVEYTFDDLIACGTLTRPFPDLLAEQIRSRKALLISREVLVLRGYDRDGKRFVIEPVIRGTTWEAQTSRPAKIA